MQPYVSWNVKGREYKLKLTTAGIVTLENKYKQNLLNLMDGTPALSVMLDVVHQALQKFEHGTKLKDVMDIYDDYLEEDGSQIDFMKDVFIPIFKVSGFFSKAVAETMDEKMEEATEALESM